MPNVAPQLVCGEEFVQAFILGNQGSPFASHLQLARQLRALVVDHYVV
jgi:hypothetical protein